MTHLAQRQARRRSRPLENYCDRKKPVAAERARSSCRRTAARSAGATFSSARFRADEANDILASTARPASSASSTARTSTAGPGRWTNYEVKDGAIVCKPGKGGTIYTKEEYADFVARLEFKLPPGGNNGLAIRYPGKGDTAYVGMCELQVLDDNADQVQASSTRGRSTARPTAWSPAAARLPAADRRMELPGSDRQGLDDQGRAERHAHPRRPT